MDQKVNWGVLGVADILQRVMPAMKHCQFSQVTGIASREIKKAQQAAEQWGIPKAFGSYEDLLADPDIEVIYNPLPNHLHVPWSIKAAEAGKHVLCEKPIGLSVQEALALLKTRDRTNVQIAEAFMVRTHPQWRCALDLVNNGRIGEVRSVLGFFSYFLRDPKNVRRVLDFGGGGLMDIGCYLVFTSRVIFAEEPSRVVSLIETDPETGTDILASGILRFPSGHSVFTCGTQIAPHQRVQILGTKGRIEIQIPFNAPTDEPCRLLIDDGSDLFGRSAEWREFEICDQFTIQADLFSRSIRTRTELPVPLESSVRNMAVIEAIFRSAKSGNWEAPLV